jgi:hypothetical protein
MAEPPRPGLISVKADLVREHLVAGVHDAVLQRFPGEPDGPVAEALDQALERAVGVERAAAAPSETARVCGELARMGYLARVVEVETFEPARQPAKWIPDAVAECTTTEGGLWQATVSLCTELARAEPDERPDPASHAPSWRIPGPGGHVRHYLALEAIGERCGADAIGEPGMPEGIDSLAELKRCWLFGFLLRCCEETPPPTR